MDNYSFDNVKKNLEDLTNKINKLKMTTHNRKVGFNGKCKVCTSKHLDEIEKLREKGHTLEDIKETLNLDLSIMSLSRHFQKHYPKSQKYKLKQQVLLLENIKEAYIKYPYLENYFKDKDLEYLESFNKQCGFCLDGFKLCGFIPASTVSNCNENIKRIIQETNKQVEKENSYNYFDHRTDKINKIELDSLQLQNICLQCKEEINNNRLDLLEKIISFNFLNIPTDNKELYFNLLNHAGSKEDFINILEDVKNDSTS